jgi:hypothetical protein
VSVLTCVILSLMELPFGSDIRAERIILFANSQLKVNNMN